MKKLSVREVKTLDQSHMANNPWSWDYELRQTGSNVHAINHTSNREMSQKTFMMKKSKKNI